MLNVMTSSTSCYAMKKYALLFKQANHNQNFDLGQREHFRKSAEFTVNDFTRRQLKKIYELEIKNVWYNCSLDIQDSIIIAIVMKIY